MDSTRGTAGSGRIIGAPTSIPTRAAASITRPERGSAATMAIFTRMFRKHRSGHAQSNHTIFTAAETGASIAIIRPGPGSETPAKAGNGRQKHHEPTSNNTPSAAAWANNGSTTSVRLAEGFRTPPAGSPMVAEGATGELAWTFLWV